MSFFPSRMSRFALSLTISLLVASSSSSTYAQSGPDRLGLTEVWSKKVGVGMGGRVTGVTLHVSSKNMYQGSQVTDRFGRRTFFSDHDPLGAVSRAGYNQTDRRTEMLNNNLTARGLDPQIEKVSIPNSTLYIRSSRGTVVAIDAETGVTKWTTKAGTNGYPSFGVAANDDFVVAVSSAKLYLLDAKSGKVLDSRSTKNLPSGTPTIDKDLIYVPTWRGLIEVYSVDDIGRYEYTIGSPSRVVGEVRVATESVSWANESGDLYVVERGAPNFKYRVKTPEAISAPAAYAEGMLFAPSSAGFVYAIEESKGAIEWRYVTGDSVDQSPFAAEGSVFVVTDTGRLISLDAQSGEENWTTARIDHIVSAGSNHLYVMTQSGRLAAIDMSTGQNVGSTSVGGADMAISNPQTDRLLILTGGTVRCFREADQLWPIVRRPVLEVEEAPEETKTDESADPTPISPSAEDDVEVDDSTAVGSEDDDMEADGDDFFGDFGDDTGDDDMDLGADGDDIFGGDF